ncbi:MAG: PH domain-containing protein [Muribaculaceae bacterium]|nr:PH domain-containing protein [Muribaculaceae bacterium]
MDNSIVPPPYIPPEHYAVFRCKVDKQQYIIPLVIWCILDIIILIVTPNILLGSFIVSLSIVPIGVALLWIKQFWGKITYIIEGQELRIITPLKSISIKINNIKKIKRVNEYLIFHKGRDFSASHIKLRIIYDRSNHVYVSPEDEESFVNTLQAINPNIEYSSERGLKS